MTEGICKWVDRRLDLGDDNLLVELAVALDLIEG